MNTPSNGMAFYPISLNLTDKPALVIGGGVVAHRKITRLLAAGARVTVISPSLGEALQELVQTTGSLNWKVGPYTHDSIAAPLPILVLACTNDPAVNRQVVEDANAQGIWVNSATEGTRLSDFITPSVLDYGELLIALSSSGASPMFIKRLKASLDEQLGAWVTPYLSLLRQVREYLQTNVADEGGRKTLLSKILDDDDLLSAFQSGTLSVSDGWDQVRQRHLAQVGADTQEAF